MAAILFNPGDPQFNADPYRHYRRLRQEDPVHRSPLGVWFLARYEDARLILRDRRFVVWDIPAQVEKKSGILKRALLSGSQPAHLDNLTVAIRHWLSFIEPPAHTRIRRLVSDAFRQRTVEELRERVRESANELLDSVRPSGRMDVIADFARLLPSKVIATLLGVPTEDMSRLIGLTEQVSRIFDPLMSLEQYGLLDGAALEFAAYLRQLIKLRRAHPQPDLITALVQAQEQQDALSDDELISTCVLLFSAGSETTVNLIGNGVLALLQNPDKMAYLREHPQILPQAVEEFLRYDAPLQMTSRTAIEDVPIGNKVIHEGEQAYAVVGSANRDPDVFADPDELVFDRASNHHLSFAAGHHLCLGAPLARLEGQEAIGAVLERLKDVQLVGDLPGWRAHVVLRGLNGLPVRFG
jgi:cytochrome P450